MVYKEYKEKDLIIRIRYNTFLRLRRLFHPTRKESMASYFRRLAKWLEVMKGGKNGK